MTWVLMGVAVQGGRTERHLAAKNPLYGLPDFFGGLGLVGLVGPVAAVAMRWRGMRAVLAFNSTRIAFCQQPIGTPNAVSTSNRRLAPRHLLGSR